MRNLVSGAILVVLAVGFLYAASAVSGGSRLVSWFLLGAFAVAVFGIFSLLSRCEGDVGIARNSVPGDPHPWAGAARTLGILLICLFGLLAYVGVFVGAHAGVVGWVIYPFIGLMFLGLGSVVALTFGKV